MSDSQNDENESAAITESLTKAELPTRTPMYRAIHAARYERQVQIRDIQSLTGNKLICYVCGVGTFIDRDDILGFADLLHNVSMDSNLDLLLHTGGGDIDASEKLINMVRTVVREGKLRVIVPDYAKSSGTLMALGADAIVMSDTSELGPIDPQIVLSDRNGNRIQHSVQSYLDAFKEYYSSLCSDPTNAAARLMLDKLDPATVKLFEAVRSRARTFAEDQLRRWMFRNTVGKNITEISATLLDTAKWQSHGQMIGCDDAVNLGLAVEYLAPRSAEWMKLWQLYCHQRLSINDHQKLFESDFASFHIDAPVR